MNPIQKIVIYSKEMDENDVRTFANNSKVRAPYYSLDSWSKTGTTDLVSHIYLITTISDSEIGGYSTKKLASKLIKPLSFDQKIQISDFYLLADEAGFGENSSAQGLAKALIKCGLNQAIRVHAMAHPRIPGYIKPLGMRLNIGNSGVLTGYCHLNERSKLQEDDNSIELENLDRIDLLHDLEGLDREYNTFTATGARAYITPTVAASISLLKNWKNFDQKISKKSSHDKIDSLLLFLYQSPELEIDDLIQKIQIIVEEPEDQPADKKEKNLDNGYLKCLEIHMHNLHEMLIQELINAIESYKTTREREPSRDDVPFCIRGETFFVKEVKIRAAEKLLRSLKLEQIEVINGDQRAPLLSGRLGTIITNSGMSLEGLQSDCFRRQRRRNDIQSKIQAENEKMKAKSNKKGSSLFSSFFG